MKYKDEFEGIHRRREHSHSAQTHTPYLGLDPRNGVPVQCQFCSGHAFRRSTLRSDDFSQIFLMRYPVRCLRCGQRQLVSFTVASLSLSSKVKLRRRHRPIDPKTRWIDFTKHPDAPNPLNPAPSEEESHSRG
jgi:hypothetical protein